MGRGGERVETTESLSFTADKAGTIKQRGGKITWDEVCDGAWRRRTEECREKGKEGRKESKVYLLWR